MGWESKKTKREVWALFSLRQDPKLASKPPRREETERKGEKVMKGVTGKR